ncbi:MAG: amino acid ABC transporter permease [Bifidobacteriaceae bacterium]|jgi:polar amino acid transport system permease protein|nr:amino acid ABC transporter permease [Bifidobacteriaceae bacterium]
MFRKKQEEIEIEGRINAVPVSHPGRIVGVLAVLLVVAVVISDLFANPNYRFDVVGEYLFNPRILSGVMWTFILTASSMVIGVVLSMVLAIMRQSDNYVLRGTSWFFIWFFRGTPVYMQLVFWGLVGVLYPKIALGIPFGPTFFEFSTAEIFTGGVAAVLGLSLNESAYMSEIVRAGFQAVDPGQAEAGKTLGMSRQQIMLRITLPQAMRIIVPPIGNETISMLKTTSLVLAVPFAADLMYVTDAIAGRTFLPIPLLIVGGIWYLSCTSVLMVIQARVERYFGKGHDSKVQVDKNANIEVTASV